MEIRFHARASRDQIASRKFFSALLRAPRKKKLRFQQKTLLNCTAFAPHNGPPDPREKQPTPHRATISIVQNRLFSFRWRKGVLLRWRLKNTCLSKNFFESNQQQTFS
jgi:hypothetical protein